MMEWIPSLSALPHYISRGLTLVEITPRDLAGNVSSHAIVYEFSLELGHTTVSAVMIR